MDEASSESAAFRRALVDSGTVDELVRVLVALGEEPDASADPMAFILAHFGQGKRLAGSRRVSISFVFTRHIPAHKISRHRVTIFT